MMMGGGNEAYFPEGVADRRVLLVVSGGGEPRLVYQSLHGRSVKTDWTLRLFEKRGPRPPTGTLRRMLWNSGYSLTARRLTRAERAALDVNKAFAIYTVYSAGDWVAAGSLKPDGGEGPWDVYYAFPVVRARGYPAFRPIVAEEARELGLGNDRWHGPGPLRYSHAATLSESGGADTVFVP